MKRTKKMVKNSAKKLEKSESATQTQRLLSHPSLRPAQQAPWNLERTKRKLQEIKLKSSRKVDQTKKNAQNTSGLWEEGQRSEVRRTEADQRQTKWEIYFWWRIQHTLCKSKANNNKEIYKNIYNLIKIRINGARGISFYFLLTIYSSKVNLVGTVNQFKILQQTSEYNSVQQYRSYRFSRIFFKYSIHNLISIIPACQLTNTPNYTRIF